jgi:hypothetical protein
MNPRSESAALTRRCAARWWARSHGGAEPLSTTVRSGPSSTCALHSSAKDAARAAHNDRKIGRPRQQRERSHNGVAGLFLLRSASDADRGTWASRAGLTWRHGADDGAKHETLASARDCRGRPVGKWCAAICARSHPRLRSACCDARCHDRTIERAPHLEQSPQRRAPRSTDVARFRTATRSPARLPQGRSPDRPAQSQHPVTLGRRAAAVLWVGAGATPAQCAPLSGALNRLTTVGGFWARSHRTSACCWGPLSDWSGARYFQPDKRRALAFR